MPSPFSKFANVTLVFNAPTASAMGDLGYPESETEPLIVIAFVKADGAATRQFLQDGELSQAILKGRAVNPMLMPATLQPSQKAQAVFWRVQKPFRLPTSFASIEAYEAFLTANEERIVMRGDFFLGANLPGSVGVEAIAGDEIRGTLNVHVGWGEAV